MSGRSVTILSAGMAFGFVLATFSDDGYAMASFAFMAVFVLLFDIANSVRAKR